MQVRSWMAALTLAVASAAAPGPDCLAGPPTPIKQTVKLVLRLDGITNEDGEVVIKPGHPGCRFPEIARRISELPPPSGDGMRHFPPFEVETVSADRDCSFAITLKLAGKPDQTFRRSLFLVPAAEGRPAAPQQLRCYVSSNPQSLPIAGKPDDTKRKK